jgi:hypothetical protein
MRTPRHKNVRQCQTFLKIAKFANRKLLFSFADGAGGGIALVTSTAENDLENADGLLAQIIFVNEAVEAFNFRRLTELFCRSRKAIARYEVDRASVF